MKEPIYLDYNATTPVSRTALEAMMECADRVFGNPSSSHDHGRRAKERVDLARGQVSRLLGCRPAEVIFTSGGSESNNLAIQGVVRALRGRGNHIVTSVIEHPAVLEVCRFLRTVGVDTTYVPVDRQGRVSARDVEQAVTPQTILITIMHANNEVGTVQPIEEVSEIARRRGILLHIDAAQSAGKIPVSVEALGVDLLSLAGHKLYAPKGVGALFVRQGVRVQRMIHGAGQEQGLRAGTENVPGIAALGVACACAAAELDAHATHMRFMRDRLEQGLIARLGSRACVHGPSDGRLPNTLSLGIRNVEANALLAQVAGEISASAGAACHSGGVQVSHVLSAMHCPTEYAMGTIRLSTGRRTTEAEVDRAVEIIAGAVRSMLFIEGNGDKDRREDK